MWEINGATDIRSTSDEHAAPIQERHVSWAFPDGYRLAAQFIFPLWRIKQSQSVALTDRLLFELLHQHHCLSIGMTASPHQESGGLKVGAVDVHQFASQLIHVLRSQFPPVRTLSF